MKNLKNYDVLELNSQNVKTTNGGFILLIPTFIVPVAANYIKDKIASGDWKEALDSIL